MKCYLCVYRQPIIADRVLNRSLTANEDRPKLMVGKFLSRYSRIMGDSKGGSGRFYDWGDDPSFFGAEEFIGDVRRASWGVCRPNVRRELSKGDFVTFFCAQQQSCKPTQWNYHYIGIGTVGKVIRTRDRIWTTDTYSEYRKFYNLLIDESRRHREVLYPHHSDWTDRRRSPYILFESSERTQFNLRTPLLVATYDAQEDERDDGVLESWQTDDELVWTLNQLIANRPGGRKLRTSNPSFPHPHMNLSRGRGARELCQLREELLSIARVTTGKG